MENTTFLEPRTGTKGYYFLRWLRGDLLTAIYRDKIDRRDIVSLVAWAKQRGPYGGSLETAYVSRLVNQVLREKLYT